MRHNRKGVNRMTNLIIELPDDLVLSLQGIAAAQRKSLQQLALGLILRQGASNG